MNRLFVSMAFLALSIVHIEHALHVFQQNRYELKRLSKWLYNDKNWRLNGYLFYIAIAFILEKLATTYLNFTEGLTILIFTILTALALLCKEEDKEYVKPLVYTPRVKRQVLVMAILDVLYIGALAYFDVHPIILAVLVPLVSWILLYPMALITKPIEARINQGFLNEAKAILQQMPGLIKVGITGSYGKTSTKNILQAVISDKYYSLMTPASYNTPMGITRTIREQLKPIHEVFLCEMGADHVDDISYLMDFVAPKIGILTSIGPQHLNTFNNLENIIREKVQVIEKLPEDGLGIINGDDENIRSYYFRTNCHIVKVGIESEDLDYRAYDINYGPYGSSFKVVIKDQEVSFTTRLLGKHNITNILLAIALADYLDIPISTMQEAIAELKPIEHRLELKYINGYRFIDNAFNSNPVSSKMSLDVLAMMPGRRIIITPGLIDLGKQEPKYNYDFGTYMVDKVDEVVLVGAMHTKPIAKALADNGFDMMAVKVVDSAMAAFSYVYQNFSKDDSILLENDLPDAFLN